MTKRRSAPRSSKAKDRPGAVDKAEPTGSRRKAALRHVAAVLGPLATVGLLSASFTPVDLWPLAYVALVPWLLALNGGTSRREELLAAWLGGLLFWAVNLYWLWWVTLVGYGASVFYLSLYWLIAGAVLRSARRRGWPMWAMLPVVWVALEYARAYVISGFPWFYLAHSQYARTPLIQIADLTGQYGVSFFVAMVNGAVVDVLTAFGRQRPSGRSAAGRAALAVVACVLVGGAMTGYGYWRLGQQTTKPGPVIGIVQRAFPISLGGRTATAEKILSDHLRSSEKFVGGQCDVVIWPETMLPRGLNPEMLELDPATLAPGDLRPLAERLFGPEAKKFSDEALRDAIRRLIESELRPQAKSLAELSGRLGCPILAGGSTIRRNRHEPVDRLDRWVTLNSVLRFEGNWRASAVYSKVHLVPFGEYVPFKRSWPCLHKLLRRFVPAVMDQVEPGSSLDPVEITANGRLWRLALPICYEGTFARVCRKLAVADGTKRIDILANLSNDGWFVYKKWGRGSYRGSFEHSQHLVQYCFRAIENRVPVVRAVNTGISASIDSNGRILAEVCLPLEDCRLRTMIPGVLLLDGAKENGEDYEAGHGPRVLVDSRVSVYSLTGDVFAPVTSFAAVALTTCLISTHRREAKGKR